MLGSLPSHRDGGDERLRKELLERLTASTAMWLFSRWNHHLIPDCAVDLLFARGWAEGFSRVAASALPRPVVDGQALASSRFSSGGVRARHRALDLDNSLARQEHQAGTLGASRRDRASPSVAGSRIYCRCARRQREWWRRAARVTPMGTTRASSPISAGRGRARHVGYDAFRSGYAARRGAGLFQPRQRRYRIEVYPDNPQPHRRYRRSVTEAAQRRSSWWTAPAQSTFFTRCRSSANVMFCPHPDVCFGGANIVSGLIMLVTDKGADIAILRTMDATQGAACACSSLRRRHRLWSARWSASVGLVSASTSSRSASSSPGDQHQLFRGAILPVEAAGRGRVGETAAVVIMALTRSFWRRSITWGRARARSIESAAVRVSARWSGGQRGSGGLLARDPRSLPQGEETLTSSTARRALWEGAVVALVAPFVGTGKSTVPEIAGFCSSDPDEGEVYAAAPHLRPVGRRGTRIRRHRDRLRLPSPGCCRNSRRSRRECCRR